MSHDDVPIRVEVWRGDVVESEHVVDAVVADASGGLASRWGEQDRGVIPRSAIKAVQALPLVASGAAEALDVSGEELALACSSHSGEPAHVQAVQDWLARIGFDGEVLECGPDRPIGQAAADALVRSGVERAPVHNCCSGKHSGFIATALHMNEDVAGYLDPSSKVQQRVQAAMKAMTDVDLADQAPGIDGCGIPVFEFPLIALAKAMARLVDRSSLGATLGEAAGRIATTLPSRAWWVAGSGRAEVLVTDSAQQALIVKGGAEGVFMGALPEQGLGFALKARDGAARAVAAALDAMLVAEGVLDERALDGVIRNKAGNASGRLVAHLR